MNCKLMLNDLCEDEFVQLNFQFNDNATLNKLNFFKRQNYDIGKKYPAEQNTLTKQYH